MEEKDPLINKISASLKGKLPGRDSQFKMAPGVRLENNQGFYRNAAVMILLYRKEGKWHFILMKRPEYAGAHSGQVSLPGGIHEKEDPDMLATALRETREELGVDENFIRVLGSLSRLQIPVSGIEVSPFVGVYPPDPEFRPDPAEVDYLIEVPLDDLVNPSLVKDDVRAIHCRMVRVPYFSLEGEQVWGATAMILSEFLDVLETP